MKKKNAQVVVVGEHEPVQEPHVDEQKVVPEAEDPEHEARTKKNLLHESGVLGGRPEGSGVRVVHFMDSFVPRRVDVTHPVRPVMPRILHHGRRKKSKEVPSSIIYYADCYVLMRYYS